MLSVLRKCKRILSHHYNFSKISDPYKLLGVDKSSTFAEIKKAYLKLANEFHPDKQSGSVDKFLIVKQAYQIIKSQRGQSRPQNFRNDNQQPSMRPNAFKFKREDQEEIHNTRDYRIFQQKAKAKKKEEYLKFNPSLETVTDINDIKVRVEPGQMRDMTVRFHLEKQKAYMGKMKPNSKIALPMVIIIISIVFLVLKQAEMSYFEQNQQQFAKDIEKVFQKSSVEAQKVSAQQLKLKVILADPDVKQAIRRDRTYNVKKNIFTDPIAQIGVNEA